MNFETFKDLTRIEQTLFALPFVLSGAILAFLLEPIALSALIWILPAFLLARFSGMAFNQLIDRHIDAKNPRTKNRAIPSGRATAWQARVIAWGSLALFILVCWKIHFLCFLFSPVAAFLIFIYSYMKRVHASCHFILGLIHFLGPVMAYIALSGTLSWSVLFLGLAACFSIAGIDIVYAIQDYHFDREQELHSIPTKLGIEKSFLLSRLLHISCVVSLLCAGLNAKLPFIYYGSLFAVSAVFSHFHTTVAGQYKRTHSVTGIESVFFFSTVAVSSSTLLFIFCSALWAALF